MQIATTFDSAFGAGKTQVEPVLAGWVIFPSVFTTELDFMKTNYGGYSQYVSCLAIAPYISVMPGADVAGLTLDQLFASMNEFLPSYFVPWIQQNEAFAQQWGLPLVTYEGGQSLTSFSNLNYSVIQKAMSDPRMYQVYVAMLNDWNEYVGPSSLFMQYTFTYVDNDYGFWGLLQYASDIGSQKYDAMLSELLTAGDANKDGVVDYADFQILAADYGMTGAWWEQGDFNDDGVVNWADLNILRTNLDPAATTLQQFAQIATFGQPASISSGQTPEYDGYGVTYVSDMPWVSSTSGVGVVQSNATASGSQIVLGGQDYAQGLGVYADSNVVVNLNGAYSRFESDIGVDGQTGGSVIFDVYGDGKLLYQSPTLTAQSGAVPIDLNVSGVQQLSLVVNGATSNTAGDHAVWADARLISTADFSQYQVTPYTLTWQVSEDDEVLTTDATDSFVFPYTQPGVYTLTLTVTSANGATAQSSTIITVNPQVAAASVVKEDYTTGGNWIGTYGSQGYDVAGGGASLPAYAVVSTSGASLTTWLASTTDPRGLEEPLHAARSLPHGRHRASFHSMSISLTERRTIFELYAVDWSASGPSEEIVITNTISGAVLATQTISNFGPSVYVDFLVSGNVTVTVIGQGMSPAVSGLFFDPATAPPTATATFLNEDTTTQGDWIGKYGSQGYDLSYDAFNQPSYADVTVPVSSGAYWNLSANAPQALLNPTDTDHIAAYWAIGITTTIDASFTDGLAHDLAMYFLDWNDQGFIEQVQVSDAATGTVLNTQTISNFQDGIYLDWVISGSVVISIKSLGPGKGLFSGLFFDPPSISALAVNSVTPAASATGVSTYGSGVSATFNEPIIYGTLSFVLDGPNSTVVPAIMTYNSTTDTATLVPTVPLAASTTYTATVSQAENLAGSVMASPFSWSFKTAATATAPPLVTSQTPSAGGTASSPLGPLIAATWNEPVSASTISFVLKNSSGNVVSTSVSYNSTTDTATLTSSADLVPGVTYTVTLSGAQNAAGTATMSPDSWSFTAPNPAGESLWTLADSPTKPTQNQSNSVNLGIKFSSDVAGYVTSIRFYKGPYNIGTHIGYLWTSTGTLLASATFTNETASGWQQVNFSTPVAIAANTIYVASYFCPDGYYPYDANYFGSSGVTSGDLEAPSSSAANGNDVYLWASSGAFPTESNAANYWVDVVFNPGLVTSTAPATSAAGVGLVTPVISATVNPTVEAGTLSLVLTTASGTAVPATFAYNSATSIATLTPAADLNPSTTYTATLSGVVNVGGAMEAASYSWSFTTTPIATESLWSASSSPAKPTQNQSNSVNLGIKFSSDVAGYVTSIRFYKGPYNTGTHIGYLWTSTGTLLASATFTNETASGWQQVNFSTPVAIAANTIYVASYFCPDGYYPYDANYFGSSGVTRGDLEAPSSSAADGNDMYLWASSGAFPTES